MQGLGYGVQGLRFRVRGSGFGVQGSDSGARLRKVLPRMWVKPSASGTGIWRSVVVRIIHPRIIRTLPAPDFMLKPGCLICALARALKKR